MATIDTTTVPARRVEEDPGPSARDLQRLAAREFGEVLASIGDQEGIDAVLRPAAAALCRIVGVGRCSMYLPEGREGRFRGVLGHPRTLDAYVRTLTVGGPSDVLTTDMVQGAAPIAVPDVSRDPRAARSVIRTMDVRSVLALPMMLDGRILAVAYLDDEGRRHDFTDAQQQAATRFGGLVARWIDRSLRVAQLGVARDELARERVALRRVALVERRLAEVADGSFDDVLATVAEAAGRPAEVVGADGELVARALPEGPGSVGPLGPRGVRAVLERLSGVPLGQARLVEPDLARGLTHRCAATPMVIGGGARGALLLVEQGTRLGTSDVLLAVRSAAALQAAGLQRHTVQLARDDARELLAAQLLGEPLDDAAVGGPADRLGLADGRARFVLVCSPEPPGGLRDLAASLGPRESVAVRLTGGDALVVDLHDDRPARLVAAEVRDEAVAALRVAGVADGTVLGVSAACRDLAGLPRALAQARALVRTAGPTAEVQGLTVDELGPARLLLTDPADAGRMGEDLLGGLLVPDPAVRELLRTLVAFFACASNIRATAVDLDVHENTVRHRFGRIRQVTGLDVAGDVDDQLLARAALAALRLAGSTTVDFDNED